MNYDTPPALAGLLRRLAQSSEHNRLIVRGSLVTRYYVAPLPRPAADLDLLDDNSSFNPDHLIQRLLAVLARNANDGIEFGAVRACITWAETDFPGLRFLIESENAGPVQVDVGFGDPLVDGPVMLPLLPGVNVLCCRAETLLAWKFHGLFEHGPGRWRPKDVWDTHLLMNHGGIDGSRMAEHVQVAFSSRGTALQLCQRLFDGEFGHSKWSRKKWRRFRSTPPYEDINLELQQVLDGIARVFQPWVG